VTAADRVLVSRLARAAGVRPGAVLRVLDGREVWPSTYEAILAAARELGAGDVPPPAPRASRRAPPKPCPECASKAARIAALETELAALRARAPKLAVVPAGEAAG